MPDKSIHPLPAPMLFPVIFWAAGIILARWLSVEIWIPVGMAILLFAFALRFRPFRPYLILLLFLVLGFLRYSISTGSPGVLEKALADRTILRQEVSFRVIRRMSERALAVELSRIAGIEVREQLLLFDEGEFSPGAAYTALADIRRLSADPILDIYPNRFAGSLTLVLPAVRDPAAGEKQYLSKPADFVFERLKPLPKEHAALARALLLSDSALKSTDKILLSRAGISHLVVVSGLHVLFLYFIIITVLRFFLPFRVADVAFLIVIGAFAALNHWAAPISRAILMIGIGMMAKWLSRPLSSGQNLSLSLLIITLISPDQLFSVGLILSFTAVAIIVFALPKLPRIKQASPLVNGSISLLNYMLLSLVVGVGMLPLTLYYFGTASLNGVLGILLGLPLISALLALALTILIFPIGPFYQAFAAVANLWQWWLEFCARLPFQLSDHWLAAGQSIAVGLVLVALMLLMQARLKGRFRYALALLLIAAGLFFWPRGARNRITLYNAGTADCSIIHTSDGSTVMIDTGGVSTQRAETALADSTILGGDSWAEKKLIPALQRTGVKTIDYLILTHLHSDHAGGLAAICKRLRVKNILISRQAFSSRDWQMLSGAIDLSGTRVHALADTLSLHFGKQTLTIVHPDKGFTATDENNASLVCRFDDTVRRYLFTGDIEAEAEGYLLANYPDLLAADILKVPHHGSRGSSTAAFLDAVKAEEAWISCTASNVHGFPHAETLQRLTAAGMEVLTTAGGSISRPLAQKD